MKLIFIGVVRQQFVIGDQLLDFSVPELVRSQSTFSTDSEVLQNCAGFTLYSSAGLAVSNCAAVMGLTVSRDSMHVVCTDLLLCCVYWIIISWILNCESVILWLGGPMFLENSVAVEYFWGSGYHKLSTNIDYLNFQPKSSTFNKKLTQNIRSFKWTADFIFHILKATTALCCVSQCTRYYLKIASQSPYT